MIAKDNATRRLTLKNSHQNLEIILLGYIELIKTIETVKPLKRAVKNIEYLVNVIIPFFRRNTPQRGVIV